MNRPNCTAWERFCKAGTRKPIQLSVRCSIPAECDKNPALADEAKSLLGAKSRTEAVHVALRELVALKRFNALMKKNGGKLSFAGLDE
jgi:Bacterial antitoxin of type II TA system, VapB